jgi:hypothetical protein
MPLSGRNLLEVMTDIVIAKKNEVFLKIEAEPHIYQELSEHFTFDVPGLNTEVSIGMERFVFSQHILEKFMLVFLTK